MAEDVEEWKAQLEGWGSWAGPVRVAETTEIAFALFKDPGGLPLEIYQPSGSAVGT